MLNKKDTEDSLLRTLVKKLANEETWQKLRSLRDDDAQQHQIVLHLVERNTLRRTLCRYFGELDRIAATELLQKLNANCGADSKLVQIANQFPLIGVVLAQGIDPDLVEFAAQDLGPTSADSRINIIDVEAVEIRGQRFEAFSAWGRLLSGIRPLRPAELPAKLKILTALAPNFVTKLEDRLHALDAEIRAKDDAECRAAREASQHLEEYVMELGPVNDSSLCSR